MADRRAEVIARNYRTRLRSVRAETMRRLAAAYAKTLREDEIKASYAEFVPLGVRAITAGQGAAQTLTRAYIRGTGGADPLPVPNLAGTARAGHSGLIPEGSNDNPTGTITEALGGLSLFILSAIKQGASATDAINVTGAYFVDRVADNEITRVVDAEIDGQAASNKLAGWEGIIGAPSDACVGNAGFHTFDEEIYRHPGCNCVRQVVMADAPAQEVGPPGETVAPDDAARALEDAWSEPRYGLVDTYLNDSKPKEFQEATRQLGVLGQKMPNARPSFITAPPGSGYSGAIKANEAIAQYRYGEGEMGKLELFDSYWKTGGKERLYFEDTGFHVAGTSNPAGYMTHEYGHAVEDYLKNFAPQATKDAFSDWTVDFFEFSRPVSGYAQTDDAEKFAELFAQTFAPGAKGRNTVLSKSLREMLTSTGEYVP